MPDILINVPGREKFIATKSVVTLKVDAEKSWEVFPAFCRFPKGKHTLQMESDADGNVTYSILGEEPVDPVMTCFCFIDDTFTIQSDGDIKVTEPRFLDPSGNEVAEQVEIATGSAMTANSLKNFTMHGSRIMLKITVHAPSQLSIDLFAPGNDKSFAELNLAHKQEKQDNGKLKCWCDVWFYPQKDGRFLPSEGKKIGFFEYNPQEPYVLAIAVMQEDLGDWFAATVKGTITSLGKTTALRKDSRVHADQAEKILVRESGMTTGGSGSYQIELVGAQ